MAKGILNASQRRILMEIAGPEVELASLEKIATELLRLARLNVGEFRGLVEGTHKVVALRGGK